MPLLSPRYTSSFRDCLYSWNQTYSYLTLLKSALLNDQVSFLSPKSDLATFFPRFPPLIPRIMLPYSPDLSAKCYSSVLFFNPPSHPGQPIPFPSLQPSPSILVMDREERGKSHSIQSFWRKFSWKNSDFLWCDQISVGPGAKKSGFLPWFFHKQAM